MEKKRKKVPIRLLLKDGLKKNNQHEMEQKKAETVSRGWCKKKRKSIVARNSGRGGGRPAP